MNKDKSIKGKIKRAVKRAKKAKRRAKTLTRKIGQQQSQRIVLNLADTGKRGGLGVSQNPFPTIVQRDTSSIDSGLSNILNELRQQREKSLELQRVIPRVPLFTPKRLPMRIPNEPINVTKINVADQEGTFPVSNFQGLLQGEVIDEPYELQSEDDMRVPTDLTSQLKQDEPDESGTIESEIVDEKNTPQKRYAPRITDEMAMNMSDAELQLPQNRKKPAVIRERNRRELERQTLIAEIRGAERAFKKPSHGSAKPAI